LGEVARVVHQPTAPLITTDALQYTLDLYAYRDTRPISDLLADSQRALEGALPPGVHYQDFGDDGEGGDSSRRMMIGMGLGILVLFGVLVPAYGSLGLGLLSIAILPLSAIGAMWGLIALDKAMCMPAIMGVILLFSIIIKNSILMVEFIQTRRRGGAAVRDAAEESIRLRYRPILMTAAATIAGMLPIALEHAVGLERLSPLADAAIGGLVVGTVLSLFYLPMFYVWMTKGAMASNADRRLAQPWSTWRLPDRPWPRRRVRASNTAAPPVAP
jgi:multidrug efflux pump subunit AcrB